MYLEQLLVYSQQDPQILITHQAEPSAVGQAGMVVPSIFTASCTVLGTDSTRSPI